MKITLAGIFALLFLAVSCKKDNDSNSNLDAINGSYKVYKMVIEDPNDGPLEYPVPRTDGSYSKFTVTASKDSSTSVKIYYFNKQNDTTNKATLSGRVKKDANGDLRFVNGNTWLGTFIKNAEVELYADAKTTLYARK